LTAHEPSSTAPLAEKGRLFFLYFLAGFLLLVREVRYAHLTEYHNLNLEEAVRKGEEFRTDPGRFAHRAAVEKFGEKIVNASAISDDEWQKWGAENKDKYAAQFAASVEYAARWKRRVPAVALKFRMRWLTVGAILVSLGVLLQGIATSLQ
jgi:hypothetical protein